MPFGSFPASGPLPSQATEWFGKQFLRARTLVPAADFDTVIGDDFAETATSELVDVVGAADASPLTTLVRGGVVEMTAGAGANSGSAALQLTGAGAHVQLQNAAAGGPWYMASLAKFIQSGAALTNDLADMIAISDDGSGANFISLGMFAAGSGGSSTNWVGALAVASSVTTTLGPTLDPSESPVWHLFEVWNDGTNIHFAIDGTEFAATLSAASAAAVFGKLKCRASGTANNAVACDYDKWVVVVKSMTVGSP